MDIPISKQKEFLQTLIVIIERIRMENGCLACDFLKDVVFHNRYKLIGKWKKEDDLNNHLSSEDFSVLRGAMSLLHSPPEIRVYFLSPKKGMEVINKRSDRQSTNNVRI
jgi:quinol monooxygenase YgiN